MTYKPEFPNGYLSVLDKALLKTTESLKAAQSNYDAALDDYAMRHAELELEALTEKAFVDKDGNPRAAANDMERRSLQKMKCAQDDQLAALRVNMKHCRAQLKYWMSMEKNYRAILAVKAGGQ